MNGTARCSQVDFKSTSALGAVKQANAAYHVRMATGTATQQSQARATAAQAVALLTATPRLPHSEQHGVCFMTAPRISWKSPQIARNGAQQTQTFHPNALDSRKQGACLMTATPDDLMILSFMLPEVKLSLHHHLKICHFEFYDDVMSDCPQNSRLSH